MSNNVVSVRNYNCSASQKIGQQTNNNSHYFQNHENVSEFLCLSAHGGNLSSIKASGGIKLT